MFMVSADDYVGDGFTIPADVRSVGGYNVTVVGDEVVISLRKTDTIDVRYDCAIVLPKKHARWLAAHLESVTRSVYASDAVCAETPA